MNRTSAIILSLLLLWANGAYGFSRPCCCTSAIGISVGCADEGTAISGSWCDHEGACNGCGCTIRSSFRCVGEFEPLRFSAFESVRPGSQIFALPAAVIDFPEFMQNFRSIPGRTHSFPSNLTDLFLQTCSFLS
jgi:hypothetical protein